MKWASALSAKADLDEALRDCADTLKRELAAPPDLLVAFLSPHFSSDYGQVPRLAERALKHRRFLGCSAGGVIGAGLEVEHQPAVALMGALLPGTTLTPFHLQADGLPDMDAPPKAWAAAVGGVDRAQKPNFLLVADPFTFNPEELARGLDFAFGGSVSIGGLASGASRPGDNALFLDGQIHRSGLVGLAFTGNVAIDPIVAQGCRPIGKPMRVTSCDKNVLEELDGKRALQAVEDLLETLPDADQQLARTSLFLGLLSDPLSAPAPKRDYLIRNLIGLDSDRGSIAIGAMLRPGQTVQFHLRDKRTSAEDLKRRLDEYAGSKSASSASGALLFSCLGRGKHLYGVSNHDSEAFQASVGKVPLGGFFCNGEIGPVEGTTHLHGYTSCFGIFRPLQAA